MKLPSILFIAISLLFSCKPKTGDTADQHLRQENFNLKQENDSLKDVIAKSQPPVAGDTIQKTPEVLEPSPTPTIAGRHDLTLHWISWERPGSAMITATGGGGYTITGSQKGNGDLYLKVSGKIRPLSERELEFDGIIEHNVHKYLGEPCVRKGKQLFKATGTRKYWRLQNMLSCDSTTTDYVDIYF